jgi:hypothetical protein
LASSDDGMVSIALLGRLVCTVVLEQLGSRLRQRDAGVAAQRQPSPRASNLCAILPMLAEVASRTAPNMKVEAGFHQNSTLCDFIRQLECPRLFVGPFGCPDHACSRRVDLALRSSDTTSDTTLDGHWRQVKDDGGRFYEGEMEAGDGCESIRIPPGPPCKRKVVRSIRTAGTTLRDPTSMSMSMLDPARKSYWGSHPSSASL